MTKTANIEFFVLEEFLVQSWSAIFQILFAQVPRTGACKSCFKKLCGRPYEKLLSPGHARTNEKDSIVMQTIRCYVNYARLWKADRGGQKAFSLVNTLRIEKQNNHDGVDWLPETKGTVATSYYANYGC